MYPQISLIIPVYNAESYLVRCIDSVLGQDYPNLEIVLINDGSTDNSGKICDEFAQKYSNLRVFHIPNGGASLAREKGIEVARGEYLTFVDSDDYVAPNYVSTMYNLLKKYETRISACGVRRICENEEVIESEYKNGKDELLDFDKLMPRFFKYEFWGFPGGLYHRSVFNNLMFPKATLSEDYNVKTQMFCNERQMAVTSTPLYFYEYHPESLSHTKLSVRAFEEYENVKAVYDYVQVYSQEYSDYALSNVVETAVKLYLMGTVKDHNVFKQQYVPILQFLKKEKFPICHCKILNQHVRHIAYLLSKCPQFTYIICRFFFL